MKRIEQTTELHHRAGTSIVGVYTQTLCKPSGHRDSGLLRLDDAAGVVLGIVAPDVLPQVTCRAVFRPVLVSGLVQMMGAQPVIRVTRQVEATEEEIDCAADLLPLVICADPAKPALQTLARLERSLSPPLSGFLKRVLLDPKIAYPLLSCRSSVSHHHHYEGGLLVHSLDMVQSAVSLAQQALPAEPLSAELAALGYFLHDLGKIRTVGSKDSPPNPHGIRHETYTLMMLAPHLEWLRSQDKESAIGLTYILDFLAKPQRGSQQARYLVAEIIDSLDRVSAASENGRSLIDLLNPEIRRNARQQARDSATAANDARYQETAHAA